MNLLDMETFQVLKDKTGIKCTTSRTQLFGYANKSPIPLVGSVQCMVESKQKLDVIKFVVVKDGKAGNILGRRTAERLGLIKMSEEAVVNSMQDQSCSIADKFPKVFEVVGKLKGLQLKIHTDPTIEPVAQKQRKVPFHLQERVEKKIDELIALGIVERVSEPT